ncbi:hypothetical protein BTW14_gp148 [BeAn 58058 virus]|nr:hypothetical protein BTW14_gp148 [BeAn 58058 virus]APG58339.1 hypothetical protein BAV00162 [BeAn 58058 virus]
MLFILAKCYVIHTKCIISKILIEKFIDDIDNCDDDIF